jgi:hypothetical protein
MAEIETHPVQSQVKRDHEGARCPTAVTMRAYEVYCELCGPQDALITGWCRGGFGMSELIAFLYARSFPKEEWRRRVDEAFKGMKNI